jgi:hypothetical protein
MGKEAVLEELRKSAYWEEEFIVKYDTKSIWALLATLPKDKLKRIKPLFMHNIDETKKHSEMLAKLLKKIESGEYEL